MGRAGHDVAPQQRGRLTIRLAEATLAAKQTGAGHGKGGRMLPVPASAAELPAVHRIR
jgi:hypothetical protein